MVQRLSGSGGMGGDWEGRTWRRVDSSARFFEVDIARPLPEDFGYLR